MKRMKPDEYKGIAATWFKQTVGYHLTRYGVWNLGKIQDEIERLLRNERRARTTRKSAGVSPPGKCS